MSAAGQMSEGPSVHRSGTERERALLRAIADVGRELVDLDNFEQRLERVCEILSKAAAFIGRVYIYESVPDPTGAGALTYHSLCEWNSPGCRPTPLSSRKEPFQPDGFRDWVTRVPAGQTVQGLTRDLGPPAQLRQRLDGGTLSLLIVPIQASDGHFGCIGFDDVASERIWEEAEISALEACAAVLASAVDRYRQAATDERRESLLIAGAAAAQLLISLPDFDAALDEALAAFEGVKGIDRAYIFQNRVHAATGEHHWRFTHEFVKPGVPSGKSSGEIRNFRDYEPYTSRLLAGQTVTFKRSELSGPALEHNEEENSWAMAAVPIFVDGQVWGAAGFDDCHQERDYTDGELAALQSFANAVAAAIVRQRVEHSLQTERSRRELAILDERNRIACEIHDTLAQHFSVASMQMEAAKAAADVSRDKEMHFLENAHRLVREGSVAARQSVAVLHVPEFQEESLSRAIEKLVERLQHHCSMSLSAKIGKLPEALKPDIMQHLFCIIQEALHNAIKHARATSCGVVLEHNPDERQLTLRISDNGVGLRSCPLPTAQANAGFGLNDIRRRTLELGGRVAFEAPLGGGLAVVVLVPLEG